MFGWTQCSRRLNRLTDSNACPAIAANTPQEPKQEYFRSLLSAE
jgi:hypothetical protein